MGQDEVFYVQRMMGITLEEVMTMEPGLFYWLLECMLDQEMSELYECQ
jgi:hypothetical protein